MKDVTYQLEGTNEQKLEGIDMKNWKKSRYFYAVVSVAMCVLLAFVLAGCDSKKAVETTNEVDLHATVETWDATKDMPMIAHITGHSENSENMDVYTAVEPNKDLVYETPKTCVTDSITVSWIPAITNDGGLWTTADNSGTATFTKKQATEVSKEEMNAALDALNKAVEKGDKTLSGDNAKNVVEKASAGAKNNPNVDAQEVEQKAEETNKTAENSTTNENTASGTVSEGSSGTSAGSSSNNQQTSSASIHSHSWTPVYTSVPVYETIEHPAVVNPVAVYGTVCNGCGAHLTDPSEHCRQAGRGSACSGWHEGIIGYEQQIVREAWTEQVLDHYEQALDHYECSCGATS